MHSQPFRFKRLTQVLTVGLAAWASVATAGIVEVVEFYRPSVDHYFVTANADEIGKLDSGFFVGWQRTGQTFQALDSADTSPGALPVCRFYGSPDAGLDSHFYSASAAECADVKVKFPTAWIFESANVFQIYLPNAATGQCPANTMPVYRSWNQRSDSNHRYTTNTATLDAMVANGGVAEGYGSPPHPVAMCAPIPPSALPPACTVLASSTSATVGTSVLLTANCSNAPTSYAWSTCAASGPTCTVSSTVEGTVSYTLTASNANGPGVPASIGVLWTIPPPPPPTESKPVCSLIVTAQDPNPLVNSIIVLESACSNGPEAYQWTNCVSTTNICRVRGSTTGVQTYSVTASNGGGTSDPGVANVNWVSSASPAPGRCGLFPTALYTELGTSSVTAHTLFSESPAFAWNGVWAVRFTVPSTAGGGQTGYLAVAEYGAPATYREITVSPTACDFRPTDAQGIAGPIGRAGSNTAFLPFTIGQASPSLPALTAGGTYYLNVRNFYPEDGSITCPSVPGRCDASAAVSLPR